MMLAAGCARTTTVTGPNSEELIAAHSVPIELVELNDQSLQEQVSFLGRYLLEDTFRVAVAENAVASTWGQQAFVDLVKYRSIGNSTGMGMAISQATTGDLLSPRGSDVAFWSSIGIDVVNMVLATSRMSDVSGFFMPATFENVEVTSAQQATDLAVAFTESRIRSTATRSGYAIECHKQCEADSKRRVYLLTRNKDRNDIFAPDQLYLFFGYQDLVKMPEKSEDYLLVPLLGFVPEYASPIGNTWTVFLGTSIKWNEKSDAYLIDAHSRLVTTPLSRELRRSLYAGQRNMFWGSSVAEVRSSAFYVKEKQPGLIYFDNEIYAFPDATGKIIGTPDPISVTHTVQ